MEQVFKNGFYYLWNLVQKLSSHISWATEITAPPLHMHPYTHVYVYTDNMKTLIWNQLSTRQLLMAVRTLSV